ncbi:hypothetical protein ABD87_22735 [Lysinibacillus sphaericus]|uniref:hypothetical protein n=1 Tax=Lysinibacillus sphaericus TaxID=1421 RepID=UPI0018CDA87A|nr:hypothetical protein [Lysinibacillus sphaericus]MBG9732244.1 hypothetical protein [Lysinibacillus sphaericus]
MLTKEMEEFVQGINIKVVSSEVKKTIIEIGSFNKLLVTVFDALTQSSYSTNEFNAKLSSISPIRVVEVMESNNFSLIVESDRIRLSHIDELKDELTPKDVAYYFFDVLDSITN